MIYALSLSFCLLVADVVRTTVGQQTGNDCCSIYMMDARGKAAIETRRQLPSGTFVALRVRACNTEPIAIQIWRRIDDTTFRFRWQTIITPVLSTTTRTFVTVNFNASLVLTSDDRLGLFSLANSSNFAIPYGFDETLFYLYYSTASFDDFSAFTDSVQVTTDDLRWPRSFNGSIFFCRQTGCSDVASDIPVNTTPYSMTSPSGVSPSSKCCPNAMTCDSSGLGIPLSNQSEALRNLNKQVNYITEIIRNLLSERVTGICPTGFITGTYGVGKCYLVIREKVPMAVAALRCQADYNSILVQIKNIIEDSFLRTILSNINSSGEASFWTAGMFNPITRQWFWYDESSRVKSPMTYTNWENNIQPTPSTDADVCMKLVVVQGASNSSRWTKSDCHDSNYFICQQLKTCL